MPRAKKIVPFEPAKFFLLNDIALWESTLARESGYEPSRHEGKCVIQAFRNTKPEFLNAEVASGPDREPGEVINRPMLRVLVSLGIRSVCKEDGKEDEILYSLETTFAVDYFVLETPPEEHFFDFVTFNCVHNAWPFWRQHVFDTFKRASLPVPVVPFFAGRASGKKTKAVKRKASTD